MAAQLSWPTLYSTPVIQKRVSIARPPAPPTEDSDILVLNSRSTISNPSDVGAEVLCLDLRLSLPATEPICIDWAFAGLRVTIPHNEEENAVRYHWRHTIDSHGSDEPPDEGTMVQRKDKTGESIEVETGVGLDPKTGRMGPYEEIWKSEHILPGTPFVFLTSNVHPNESTGFMAVLGSHAMGLWKTTADKQLSAVRPNEPQHFHAVRLRCNTEKRTSGEGKLPTYWKVFSTGSQALDDQLGKFVDELLMREMEGRQLWQRGERLTLSESKDRDSTWTVWDAGHVGK